MRNYVKSRGPSRSHEYTWVAQTQERLEPSILNRSFSEDNRVVRITEFHNQSSPALIVLRDNGELLLLLTGIKATWNGPGGSSIYHSIAWVSSGNTESNEEENIRRLIIRDLQGNLQNDIASAIESCPEDELGFKVDFEKLKQIEEDKNVKLKDRESNFHIGRGKLGNNNQDLKNQLVDELKQSRLPPEDGFLIVVSDFVGEQLFKDVKVWQGLSSRIQGEVKKNSMQPTPPPQQSPKTIYNPILVFLVGLAVGILMGIIISHTYLNLTGRSLLNYPYPQQHQQNHIP